MAQDFQQQMILALQRLEKAYAEILQTQGYTKDSEKLKILVEMTREQVQDENSRHSTGQIR